MSMLPFEMEWDSLAAVDAVPAALAAAVITVTHSAGLVPWDAVRRSLTEAFGAPAREARRWRSVKMSFAEARLPASVTVGKRRITVRARGKLRPARFRKLVGALAAVPNVQSVRIEGRVPYFGDKDEQPMGLEG